MDFMTLARTRYSVRAYRPDPVSDEKLSLILEAGRLAPTAANRQPFRILVVKTRDRQEELKQIYRGAFFIQAPIVLCLCSLPEKAWKRSDGKVYSDVDAAIVMDHMIMAATDQGLGTCWIGAFDPDAARKILRLPPEAEPVAFTPLGYPADNPVEKRRRSIEKLVKYDYWE